ncbi:MAG: HPP family protein [Gemmatimonadaceae bacterium]
MRSLVIWFLRSYRSTGRGRCAKVYARRLWRGWNAALVAVPLALALTEVLGQRAELRFLLYPPLASIAYLLFTRPVGPHATWLGAVIAPSIGAVIGILGTRIFQPGFLGVLTVAFAAMLAMRFLRVDTAPVLAVALLPLMFGVKGLGYPISILIITSVLFLLFKGWNRILPSDERTIFDRKAAQSSLDDTTVQATSCQPAVELHNLLHMSEPSSADRKT